MDLTPSPRKSGAQRMLSATTLICEAFVVFFAVLVAFGLYPDNRVFTVVTGMILALALGMVPRFFSNQKAWPYWLGLGLQLAMLAYGFIIPAMWFIGGIFALIYWVGLVRGHKIDREKDMIDARVLGTDGEAEQG